MNTVLLLSSVCLVAGGLLLAYAYAFRRPALAVRLARAEGLSPGTVAGGRLGFETPAWLSGVRVSYERDLRQAGGRKTLARFLAHKALVTLALPLVALLPYGAASGRLPPAGGLLLLAIAGFFVPDLMLRSEVKRRREAIFLDLPEAIAVLALALGAGQSLRQALCDRFGSLAVLSQLRMLLIDTDLETVRQATRPPGGRNGTAGGSAPAWLGPGGPGSLTL